jgi:Mg-chelatase subunit ChlI
MATPKTSSALGLTRSEVTFCKKLTEEDSLSGQRAKALLAVHQGETQGKAVELSGLSLGQVRYIVGRFRLHRIAALQAEAQSPPESNTVADIKVKSKSKNKKAKSKAKDKDKKGKKDKNKNKNKKKTKSEKKTKKSKKKKSKK